MRLSNETVAVRSQEHTDHREIYMNDLFLKLYIAANSFVTSERGQSMTEYAMAVGLIAFGCIAGEAAIARSVNQTFVATGNAILTGVSLPTQ